MFNANREIIYSIKARGYLGDTKEREKTEFRRDSLGFLVKRRLYSSRC